MGRHSYPSVQAIEESVEQSFQGIAFTTYPVSESDNAILEATLRNKSGHDALTDSTVEVYQFLGLIANRGGLEQAHRIVAMWDDGPTYEFDMEYGVFLEGGIEKELLQSRQLYDALMRAIEIVRS